MIAVGNFLGPLLLGRLFDTVGRRPMIAGTYIALRRCCSSAPPGSSTPGWLNATTLTACWCVVLFFASAGASCAYLTVSEIFPMETRAMAIAFFYAIGTAAGGISGPLLFADLTEHGRGRRHRPRLPIGAALMSPPGLVAAFLAVGGAAVPGGHRHPAVGPQVTLQPGANAYPETFFISTEAMRPMSSNRTWTVAPPGSSALTRSAS